MPAKSLQRQLRHQLIISLGLTLLGLLILLHLGVRSLGNAYLDDRLQHDAQSLIAALQNTDGTWQLNQERLTGLWQRVHSGHYYELWANTDNIRFISRSLWDAKPRWPASMGSHDLRNNGQPWRVYGETFQKQGINFQVFVAEDISAFEAQRWVYSLTATSLILLVMGILLFSQRLLLRRSFQPLDNLRQHLQALRLGEQLKDRPRLPAEILPLLEEIERLLAQLQQRMLASRHAVGNLAHGLKHPLQHLRHAATTHAELQPIATELEQLLERELKRARIVGMSSPGRQFQPAAELPALKQVLGQIYPQCHIELHYPPHRQPATGPGRHARTARQPAG